MPLRANGSYYYVDNPEPIAAPLPPAPTYTPPPAPTITQAAAPVAPPPPSSVPVGQIIQNPQSPEGNYIKALMPYLSAEDYTGYGQTYGFVSPLPGVNISTPNRFFTSRSRASGALNALNEARVAAGASASDVGYNFLAQAISLLNQYGGADSENGMSRENYQKFTSAFDELLSHASEAKVPSIYTNLAKAFAVPTFKGRPQYEPKIVGNRTVVSAATNKLYE